MGSWGAFRWGIHVPLSCVFVFWRKRGGNRRESGVKRKQRAAFPLAVTVLLPQHESPPMYYHVQEAGCLLRKWVEAQQGFFFLFFFGVCFPQKLRILLEQQSCHYASIFSGCKLKSFADFTVLFVVGAQRQWHYLVCKIYLWGWCLF